MSRNRHGKIARLPHEVRQELNRRLREGEKGKKLVAWLNGLPEVQAMVAAEFEGRPIREQNLSEWNKGGYLDWLEQEERLELAARLGADAAELTEENREPMTETLARWTVARYAVATRQVTMAEGEEGWRMLREMCADIARLRHGDQGAARLEIERERMKLRADQSARRKGRSNSIENGNEPRTLVRE